jgi:hypothetical protein
VLQERKGWREKMTDQRQHQGCWKLKGGERERRESEKERKREMTS